MDSEEPYDITIQITAGGYMGKAYNFMLAQDEKTGAKAWACLRTHDKPPSMIKHDIHMTIAARGDMMNLSAVMDDKQAQQIMEELEIIALSTNEYKNAAILTESNGTSYYVVVDKDSPTSHALRHEGGVGIEYHVELHVWSIYTSED